MGKKVAQNPVLAKECVGSTPSSGTKFPSACMLSERDDVSRADRTRESRSLDARPCQPTRLAWYVRPCSHRALFLVGVLSLLSLLRPHAQAPASDETARINVWFEKKFEEQLAFSPIRQTFLGRKSNAIDDMSLAAQDRLLAWLRASVAELKKSFVYARLSPEAQTSYNLWVYQLQQAEAAPPFRPTPTSSIR